MTRDDPIYTIQEIAKILGVSVAYVRLRKREAGIQHKSGKRPYTYSQNELLTIKKTILGHARKSVKTMPRPTYIEHGKKFLKDQGY